MKRLLLVAIPSGLVAAAVACTSFSTDADSAAQDGGPEGALADTSVLVQPDGPASDSADDALRRAAIGCADGTLEGFKNSPGIAACSGAWTVRGIFKGAPPTCARQGGGPSSVKPDGDGCSAVDLCASGWHVCNDAADVANHGGAAQGEVCEPTGPAGNTFYATAQASTGTAACAAGSAGINDVFGCGDIDKPPAPDCAPLNAVISTFQLLQGFNLGADNDSERKNVTKTIGPGGVLCCVD